MALAGVATPAVVAAVARCGPFSTALLTVAPGRSRRFLRACFVVPYGLCVMCFVRFLLHPCRAMSATTASPLSVALSAGHPSPQFGALVSLGNKRLVHVQGSERAVTGGLAPSELIAKAYEVAGVKPVACCGCCGGDAAASVARVSLDQWTLAVAVPGSSTGKWAPLNLGAAWHDFAFVLPLCAECMARAGPEAIPVQADTPFVVCTGQRALQ